MTNKIYMPFDIYAKYVEIISVMANVRYIAGIVDHTNGHRSLPFTNYVNCCNMYLQTFNTNNLTAHFWHFFPLTRSRMIILRQLVSLLLITIYVGVQGNVLTLRNTNKTCRRLILHVPSTVIAYGKHNGHSWVIVDCGC